MIVGRGESHQLADAHLGQLLVAGALELGGVFHRAGTDDGALALHQARNGVNRADTARVGQRNGDAGEVFAGELAFTGASDDVLVCRVELDEVHRLGVPDGGNYQ